MGQYWKLLNIDRKQELSFYASKIGEIMYGVDPTRLVWLLAVPRKPPPYDRAVEPGHSTDTRDLGALNIPSDILEVVFAQFEPNEIHAIISLSLTNTYLREIGQKQLWQAMMLFNGSWWLERLICVGDYVDGNDLPKGIFKGEVEEKTLMGNDQDRARIYSIATHYFDDYAERMARHRRYYPVDLSRNELHLVKEMVEPDYSWDRRPETEWILCNWTMAEYVRASAVAELTGTQCDGPWTHDRLSLGHVLLTQICWSADPSIDLGYEGPLTRGPWAGHYFGITTVDNLSRDFNCINKQPWKDATEKIMKQVLEIWRYCNPDILAKHLRDSDDESD